MPTSVGESNPRVCLRNALWEERAVYTTSPAQRPADRRSGAELIPDGKRTDALARGREDRVRERGRGGRDSHLARAGRRFRAAHDLDLDVGRLRHAQQRIAVEVALDDTAVGDRDLEVERSADAV